MHKLKDNIVAVSCLAAIVAISTLLAGIGIATASSAPPVNHCVRYDTTHAFACIPPGISHGGLIYAWYGLYGEQFYWHPAQGDAMVQESYMCWNNDARPIYGFTACSQVYQGATYLPRYDRRTVTIWPMAGLPNGCVVADWNVYPSTVPWPDITTCLPVNGTTPFPAPPVAVKTFNDFWHEMQLVPGNW